MAQKERENFYRNSTVIVDHGKESLSAVLENDLSNTNLTFEDFINKHQHEIYHLCYNRIPCCQCPNVRFVPANQNRVLYPDQLDILLDTSGSTLPGHNHNQSRPSQHCCRPAKQHLSISNLDITLLRCLLMNFAQNCRTNYILRQDVEDLVRCRNKLYGHAQEARLTDSDYTKYKIDVEGIILRIAQFCNIETKMRQKLKDASQRPLDETILEKYKISLIHQTLYEKNIEEKFDELKQQLTAKDESLHCRMDTLERKVNEVGQRDTNIIAQTEARLLEHSKDDTYVITEDVKQCCKILEKCNAIVIFAKAGGGKSKTSLQIAMVYQDKSYIPMLFVNDELARHRNRFNFNEQNIVIVEDLFGRSNINFNEDLHRGVLDVLYSCIKSESCKTKVILTIRGDEEMNRKLMEKHRIFEKEFLINLEKNRSWHSNTLILSKHMTKHGISLCECKQFNIKCVPPAVLKQCTFDVFETDDSSLKICLSFFYDVCCGKYEIQIGFPQACHLFCSNKTFTKQGEGYFTHTSQSLVEEINHLKIEGFDKKQIQYQYCVLVYIAMKHSIDLEEIDEKCFQTIISSVYDENHKIKRSLLKAAVLVLEGNYISKMSSISVNETYKRPIVSEIYVLQHNTIQEALLVSYGDDTDVLTFCDFNFLIEYIRPIGYKDDLSDHMVYVFTNYEPLVKRLINMLSINDKTCTYVGVYLQTVALLQRRDDIIQFFFHNSECMTPGQYVCLLNGLTNFGENANLIVFHPELCKELLVHSGLTVFLAFCRPIGWIDEATNFIEIPTELLLNKLNAMIDFIAVYDSKEESNENQSKHNRSFILPEIANGRYAVGNYVFENLIAKGFKEMVETLFTTLKQNAQNISPLDIKDFLDGLLDEGKRSSIVSHFKDFFEALLFKYGSIPTILQLCRPVSVSISNPNIIQVDDRLLTSKFSAFLESDAGYSSVCKRLTPAVSREDGSYFVYWDDDYFEMNCTDEIAEFILEYGVKLSNDNFVRLVYAQLVSDKEEKSDDEESESTDSDDDETDSKEFEKRVDANGKNGVYDDTLCDVIGTDEKGKIDNSSVVAGYVKKVYSERSRFSYIRNYRRLFKFLSNLMLQWVKGEYKECESMSILFS